MNASADSSIRNYLDEFNRQAAQLPQHRRDTLRLEIEEHLRVTIPTDATSAEVAAALADFGSPTEIIDQELDATSALQPAAPKRNRRLITWGIVALAVLAVLAAGLTWIFLAPPTAMP